MVFSGVDNRDQGIKGESKIRIGLHLVKVLMDKRRQIKLTSRK